MYKICSNIKCFECQDIAAQSGETCSDCNSFLVEATPDIEDELKNLLAEKICIQNLLNELVLRNKKNKQEELDKELAKSFERPVEVEPSMQDQINNLEQSVFFNKWRERKIK